MGFWYMSFTDDTRPEGDQFIGACVVEAENEVAAVIESGIIGCNPGGAITLVDIGSMAPGKRPPAEFVGRLLDREEALNYPSPDEGEWTDI